MVADFPELKIFVQDKVLKFNLAFNDGSGSIGICTEEDGIIKWEIDINE